MAVKASAQITLSCVVDVYATYRYYKLQSSILTAPSKPTTRPPTGWTDAEPTYTEGSTNSLYTVDLTVFSDGTWAYSMVQLSSAFEAAKAAYNKAQNALDVANAIPGYKHLISEYVVDQTTVDAWCEEGLSDNWTVLSTDGIRVGDTVAVRMSNSTTSHYVYAIATVTQISSPTVFVGTSHGYIDPTVSGTAQEAKIGVDDINSGKPLFVASGINGTEGYVEVVDILYPSDGSYLNKPIKFYMNQRGIGNYSMSFAWENTNSVPAIALLTTDRKDTSALAVKWSDYRCSIYVRKSESYDVISVMAIENPFTSSEMTVNLYTDDQSYSAADLISWTGNGYLMSWIDSECATNYCEFVSGTGLIVGDRRGTTLGKNVLIGNDSVDIRNGTTVLASFGANSLEFDEPVIFKADGVLLDNGDAFTYLGRNTVLWNGGASGYYMRANQSITLSANITRQVSGAIFAWSLYQNNQYVNSDWHFIFVPKFQVANYGGTAIRMYDAYLGMNKLLYVSNGNVTGHDQNATSGTTNGVAWDNTKWVLRYIVGV